jgi:ankyrin repeat protein
MPGPSPLILACISGSLEIVKLLLQHKDISVNHQYKHDTPLTAACERNRVEIVKLLLQDKMIVLMLITQIKKV